MDNNNGHPTNTGAYHYHVEPWQLTDLDGTNPGHSSSYNPDALIGIALDGCPSTEPMTKPEGAPAPARGASPR